MGVCPEASVCLQASSSWVMSADAVYARSLRERQSAGFGHQALPLMRSISALLLALRSALTRAMWGRSFMAAM
jgi:hypothetical protein